ncbi:hypothetical protein G7Y79_00027g060050 [Physcia stellaris]|nr:hypothetical protein G7Y79_00027g060050 [Physcia stellaris]
METSSIPNSSSIVIDRTTIFSLLSVLLILVSAYLLSHRLLPSTTTTKSRLLFVWHAFDALIHFFLEGSFLYNCFFTYSTISHTSDYPHPASLPAVGSFLGYSDRSYGSAHGTNPFAKLWQEYAKADKRWGEADLTIISLELLTVFGAGPLAVWVCELLRRGKGEEARLWFWASVLATGELYGGEWFIDFIFAKVILIHRQGFMTFAPEWLSGSVNLDTSNAMYLYVYLVFFNMLWVVIPLWVLYEAYGNITLAFARASGAISPESKKKR